MQQATPALMIPGHRSNAGKSTIVAGWRAHWCGVA